MSISSKLIYEYLKLVKLQDWIEEQFIHPSRSYLPEKTKKEFEVTEGNVKGRGYATIQPKNGGTNKHVFYIHGGAYTMVASDSHWDFLRKLIKEANCKLTFVDYPLAPENTYRETFAYMDEAYDKVVKAFPTDDFIIMGDSAGGGLSFAFAQRLRNNSYEKQPIQSILMSPWLDITMSNPNIEELVQYDIILTRKGLKAAAGYYAGGDDQTQYLLSPIYGNLEGLGDVHVFFGTHELFHADCIKLKELTKNLKNFHFYEHKDMQHIWIIMLNMVSEGKEGTAKIVELING